jgi:hypothetical protein
LSKDFFFDEKITAQVADENAAHQSKTTTFDVRRKEEFNHEGTKITRSCAPSLLPLRAFLRAFVVKFFLFPGAVRRRMA